MRLLHYHQARSEERGAILVMVIVMITALLLMSYAVAFNSSRHEKQLQSDFDDQRALHLAEAGLEEAFACLQAGGTGNVGTMAQPAYLGGGVFWVTAQPVDAEHVRLTSRALVGSGRRAVETAVEVLPPQDPLFASTLNSKETITLNEGVVVDSFESSKGDYASQATNTYGPYPYALDGGDVRSNQDVILNANAVVLGDATPGPGGTVQYNTGSHVSGDTSPSAEEFDFTPIEIPTFPPSGDYALGNFAVDTLPPGNYDFGAFVLNRGAVLTVKGPAEVVVDGFGGGKEANLVVDATDGPVTFYVRSKYVHERGFEASAVVGSPMALAFMIDIADDIVFPSATNIRGAYYAPHSNIVFSYDNECWGSFAGNRISMSNDMRFHFDEDLKDYWEHDSGEEYEAFDIISWNEVAMPIKLMADRRDPIQLLRLNRAALPSPWQAWQ